MMDFAKGIRLFVFTPVCDMRKQMDGLSILVRQKMQCNPQKGDVFVFRNRRRDMLKILFHDQQGYCLFVKRLEKGTFSWLFDSRNPRVEIDGVQLMRLLKNATIGPKMSQAA